MTESPDFDTAQVQVTGYEMNTQNEEQLQELLEDEDIISDNTGTCIKWYITFHYKMTVLYGIMGFICYRFISSHY